MILHPFELAAQRAFGTKVPSAMANLGRREDTVVLLARKDSPAKLVGQTSDRKLRNPTLGGPSRVVTYETQDNHSFCPDRPDAGWFPAGGCSAALCRCFHRRSFICFEPVFFARMPGSGQLGRQRRPDLSGDVHELVEHHSESGGVVAGDCEHRSGSSSAYTATG